MSTSSPEDLLGLYLHLARASQARQRPMVRDKFLVLAGVCATHLGLVGVADACRRQVLQQNPHHLVRRYPNFAEAVQHEDFDSYLGHLLKTYPLEKAEHMLDRLGIDPAAERQTYFDTNEYAAALLGVSVEDLRRTGEDPDVSDGPSGDFGSGGLGDDDFDDDDGDFDGGRDVLDAVLDDKPGSPNRRGYPQRQTPPPEPLLPTHKGILWEDSQVFVAGTAEEASVLDTLEIDVRANDTVHLPHDFPQPSDEPSTSDDLRDLAAMPPLGESPSLSDLSDALDSLATFNPEFEAELRSEPVSDDLAQSEAILSDTLIDGKISSVFSSMSLLPHLRTGPKCYEPLPEPILPVQRQITQAAMLFVAVATVVFLAALALLVSIQ